MSQNRSYTPMLTVSALVLLALLAGACNLPGAAVEPTQPPPQVFYTQAAQTLMVQLSQQAPQATTPPEETSPPPAENTQPSAPTDTLPPAETPTPGPTDTPLTTNTPSAPTIRADVDTNCRTGPSTLYAPPVGALNTNETSQVHGRNSANTWWYIENPDRPGNFCWVWGETTIVEGNTANLPVITPPPPPVTPTNTPKPGPTFSVSFETVHDCSGTPTAIFEIENTGDVDLESLRLKIEDRTDDVDLFGPNTSNAPFMGAPGECPPGGDTLEAGDTLYIGGAIGGVDSDHEARATIELCTEDDLDGDCLEKSIDFTIP
jgi:hypothetical protein